MTGGERVDEGLSRRGVLVRPQDRDRQRVVVPAGDVRARETRPLAAEEGEGVCPNRATGIKGFLWTAKVVSGWLAPVWGFGLTNHVF